MEISSDKFYCIMFNIHAFIYFKDVDKGQSYIVIIMYVQYYDICNA